MSDKKMYLVILIILAYLLMPFVLIWSVNTLFHTGILYGADTWFAALMIGILLNGKVNQ